MNAPPETLELSRCEMCRARFLPTDGACPKCGSTDIRSYGAPPLGTVLAATELSAPAEGWHSPHRLALVEMPETVRLLAIVEGPLPTRGTVVTVRREGEVYRARSEPKS
ncbi:MAG: zinc ribbon domain-containing protein [Thermoplasmata archaeon]